MKEFLAKSKTKETIQSHTDQLLKNYDILISIYRKMEDGLLYWSCIYHDLGKINKKFQDKSKGVKVHLDEIPHGILSLAFIDPKFLRKLGFSKDEIRVLAHAVAYHHDRLLNYTEEELDKEIELLKEEVKHFKYDKLENIRVKKLGIKYFAKDRITEEKDGDLFFRYVIVKGLLNRLDYAASAGVVVEIENNFLEEGLESLLKSWQEKNKEANWNDLQIYMMKNRDKNVIIIAETGYGKTEAALIWIGNNKGFFVLPLQTAINAMYSRIVKHIIKDNPDQKIGLLHSDTYSEYLKYEDKEDIEDIDEYYVRTRQLSMPLTICTLDQIFDFVYRYRGFEGKLATMAYSKVVIDEVQMYSPELLAYLVVGLSYINKVGGKFAILTATLPGVFVDLLREEGIEFEEPKTFISKRIRHSVKVIDSRIKAEDILRLYNNNKVLVICNTIQEVQRLYDELRNLGVNMLHSQFIRKDRRDKEEQILEVGKEGSKEKGIWITTQVVEASLDIDFDILITELSDLNSLFQRMGRCFRKREFNSEGYNCYVYTGSKEGTTGVGFFIDSEIFEMSKKAISKIDGYLSEEKKMKMVEELYSTENLEGTKYLKTLRERIRYVKSIQDFEKSKKEIKKIFRNMCSVNAIPKVVYDENKEKIDEYIRIINSDASRKERMRARSNLMDYTLNVPWYMVGVNDDYLRINKYEAIAILNQKYSKEKGLMYTKKTDLSIEDRMI